MWYSLTLGTPYIDGLGCAAWPDNADAYRADPTKMTVPMSGYYNVYRWPSTGQIMKGWVDASPASNHRTALFIGIDEKG